MTTYTFDQLKTLAESVGVPAKDGDSAKLAAIALAESSGNPTAVNSSTATGLWQIRWSVWGSQLTKAGIATSQQALTDPATNAKAMKYVIDHQGVTAWSTYTSGAWKKFIPAGTDVKDRTGTFSVGPLQLPTPGSLPGRVKGALGGAIPGLDGLTAKLASIAEGGAVLFLGLILLILGVIILLHKQIGKASKAVPKVIPI